MNEFHRFLPRIQPNFGSSTECSLWLRAKGSCTPNSTVWVYQNWTSCLNFLSHFKMLTCFQFYHILPQIFSFYRVLPETNRHVRYPSGSDRFFRESTLEFTDFFQQCADCINMDHSALIFLTIYRFSFHKSCTFYWVFCFFVFIVFYFVLLGFTVHFWTFKVFFSGKELRAFTDFFSTMHRLYQYGSFCLDIPHYLPVFIAHIVHVLLGFLFFRLYCVLLCSTGLHRIQG